MLVILGRGGGAVRNVYFKEKPIFLLESIEDLLHIEGFIEKIVCSIGIMGIL